MLISSLSGRRHGGISADERKDKKRTKGRNGRERERMAGARTEKDDEEAQSKRGKIGGKREWKEKENRDEVGESPAGEEGGSIKTRLKIELLTSDLPPSM